MMFSRRRVEAVLLLLWSILVQSVDSIPYILLTSTRPKCVSLLGTKGTTVVIEYFAPGMSTCCCCLFASLSLTSLAWRYDIHRDTDRVVIPEDAPIEEALAKATNGRYTDNYKRRMEILKRAVRTFVS